MSTFYVVQHLEIEIEVRGNHYLLREILAMSLPDNISPEKRETATY